MLLNLFVFTLQFAGTNNYRDDINIFNEVQSRNGLEQEKPSFLRPIGPPEYNDVFQEQPLSSRW